MHYDLLLTNIKELVQVRPASIMRVAGAEMNHLPIINNAFLACRNGKILLFGAMEELAVADTATTTLDCTDRFVFPSFVDSHTHLVFADTREEEFMLKIKGATYQQIAAAGGGILNSAAKLQLLSEDELFERSLPRAWEIIRQGTGAVEIKSGYGLTIKDELKMLRVAKRIGRETPLTVNTTFLGAHAVPTNTTKEEYIQLLLHKMIPAVADEKLADYIDVFCEQGFFTTDEATLILETGKQYGMKPRLHANQLHNSGGVQVGVQVNALSVDHLENIGDEEIAVLADSDVMPTALPGAAFFLNLPFPPARKIIEAGLPLAIASDYNPGSAPSGNMAFMLSLACIKMRMTPEEAINAATLNTASALELSATHGSITIGKTANLFVTKPIKSFAFIPYAMGNNAIETIVLNGKVVL
jgi:imidazolonepropionase